MNISLIAALLAADRIIGMEKAMPWTLPEVISHGLKKYIK